MNYVIFITTIFAMLLILISIFFQDDEKIHIGLLLGGLTFLGLGIFYNLTYICECSKGLFGKCSWPK